MYDTYEDWMVMKWLKRLSIACAFVAVGLVTNSVYQYFTTPEKPTFEHRLSSKNALISHSFMPVESQK